MSFELARRVADAVMYEGYLLYPYRPSSTKNRFRWQFGIVAPREWAELGGEAWDMQTECLLEAEPGASVDIALRFLQAQLRESAAEEWEDGIERTVEFRAISLAEISAAPRVTAFEFPPVAGLLRVAAEPLGRFFKLQIRIENHTPFPDAANATRNMAMRHALVGAHTLLAVSHGGFVSAVDPPPEARNAALSCSNQRTWPVLIGANGARSVMLSAPIILEDYPAIAAESQGDFYDAAEIDEMLTLRVMTLTDDEKREACAADDRARRIIERCDRISNEDLERLHGALRQPLESEIERFFNPPDEVPEEAAVKTKGGSVSRGARVRLAPKRRADSMDFFLTGRTATVEAIHRDVENNAYVAVTVEDDPAADLQGRVGRYFYFYPEELELLTKET
jgi:hypothetical protein